MSPLRCAPRTGKAEYHLKRPEITGVCESGWRGKKHGRVYPDHSLTHTHSTEVGQKQHRYSFEKQETGASAHARQK